MQDAAQMRFVDDDYVIENPPAKQPRHGRRGTGPPARAEGDLRAQARRALGHGRRRD